MSPRWDLQHPPAGSDWGHRAGAASSQLDANPCYASGTKLCVDEAFCTISEHKIPGQASAGAAELSPGLSLALQCVNAEWQWGSSSPNLLKLWMKMHSAALEEVESEESVIGERSMDKRRIWRTLNMWENVNRGDPRREILQGIRRKIDVREAGMKLFEVRGGKLDLSFDQEKAERRLSNLKSKYGGNQTWTLNNPQIFPLKRWDPRTQKSEVRGFLRSLQRDSLRLEKGPKFPLVWWRGGEGKWLMGPRKSASLAGPAD